MKKSKIFLFIFLLYLLNISATPPVSAPPDGLVRICDVDSTILIDLKYATADNFTGKTLYTDRTAYLRPEAAAMLHRAAVELRRLRPELRLLVYDAARPLHVQQRMWDAVKDKPYRAYVANPTRTGVHNYGVAVDLTLADSRGRPLDMGTPFDFFGAAAGITKEEEMVNDGRLSRQQVNNRHLLRQVMRTAGFHPISGEWWHFNAFSLNEAKTRFPLLP